MHSTYPTLTGAFQQTIVEYRFNSYFGEPNIVYLTPTMLLEKSLEVVERKQGSGRSGRK